MALVSTLQAREPSRRMIIEAVRIVNQGKILYMRMATPCVVRAAVRSGSGRGIHIVTVNVCNGAATCTCRGYMYRGICKHITAIRLKLNAIGVSRNLHPHKPLRRASE